MVNRANLAGLTGRETGQIANSSFFTAAVMGRGTIQGCRRSRRRSLDFDLGPCSRGSPQQSSRLRAELRVYLELNSGAGQD